MTKKEIEILQKLEAEHFLLLQEVNSLFGSEHENTKLWRARWGAYENVLEAFGIESDYKSVHHQRALEIILKNTSYESV